MVGAVLCLNLSVYSQLISLKMNDVSVISASFKTGETSKGSISVIGPTRMPYEKVVALVEYISENIEKACLEDKQDEK